MRLPHAVWISGLLVPVLLAATGVFVYGHDIERTLNADVKAGYRMWATKASVKA